MVTVQLITQDDAPDGVTINEDWYFCGIASYVREASIVELWEALHRYGHTAHSPLNGMESVVVEKDTDLLTLCQGRSKIVAFDGQPVGVIIEVDEFDDLVDNAEFCSLNMAGVDPEARYV